MWRIVFFFVISWKYLQFFSSSIFAKSDMNKVRFFLQKIQSQRVSRICVLVSTLQYVYNKRRILLCHMVTVYVCQSYIPDPTYWQPDWGHITHMICESGPGKWSSSPHIACQQISCHIMSLDKSNKYNYVLIVKGF